jgi:hypothetical protein
MEMGMVEPEPDPPPPFDEPEHATSTGPDITSAPMTNPAVLILIYSSATALSGS